MIVATDGLFSDLNTSPTAADTVSVYIVDATGNLSGAVDGAAQGVTECPSGDRYDRTGDDGCYWRYADARLVAIPSRMVRSTLVYLMT